MANEFRHADVGTQLTQAEWESVTAHQLNGQATGDLMYGSSPTQLSRLGVGTADQVLVVSGGVPSWSSDLNVSLVVLAQVNDGNSGAGTKNIDWSAGNKHTITLTGNPTFTFTSPGGECNLLLKLIQDATGGRTVTWPATAKWPGGTAPTLSAGGNDVDIVSFYFDGTNYYGIASLDFS